MDKDQWIEIDKSGKGLTPQDIKEGWHFCCEWDEMLIGPGMPECDACLCFPK